MARNLGFWGGVVLVCLCMCPMSGFGQSLAVSVGVGGGVGSSSTTLCQQFPTGTTGPITGSCQGLSWNDGAGNFGSGSATATADYGVLQSYAASSTTITTAVGGAGTASTTAADFSDYLTFPSLTSNASLKATMTVSGSASTNQASSVDATLSLSNGNVGPALCSISTVTGSCATSILVSPGDQVLVACHFQTNASTNIGSNQTGSDSATLNYGTKRNYGAQCAFVLVDSSGKAVNGAKIVAASGTRYPTH
jgi:hypothetical protein